MICQIFYQNCEMSDYDLLILDKCMTPGISGIQRIIKFWTEGSCKVFKLQVLICHWFEGHQGRHLIAKSVILIMKQS